METLIHNNRSDRFTLYMFGPVNQKIDLFTGYALELERVVQDIRDGRIQGIKSDVALCYRLAD